MQRPEGRLDDVESSMTQPLCCKSIRDMQCRILRQAGNEDNLLKYNEVNCVDKKWCGMPLIETAELGNQIGQTAQSAQCLHSGEECHESEGTHDSERVFDVCRPPNLRWRELIGTRCGNVTRCRSEGGVGKRKNTKQTLEEAESTNPGRDLRVMNLPSPEG